MHLAAYKFDSRNVEHVLMLNMDVQGHKIYVLAHTINTFLWTKNTELVCPYTLLVATSAVALLQSSDCNFLDSINWHLFGVLGQSLSFFLKLPPLLTIRSHYPSFQTSCKIIVQEIMGASIVHEDF